MDYRQADAAVLAAIYGMFADLPPGMHRVATDEGVTEAVATSSQLDLPLDVVQTCVSTLIKSGLVEALTLHGGERHRISGLTRTGLRQAARDAGVDVDRLGYAALDTAASGGDVNQLLADVPTSLAEELFEEHRRADRVTYWIERGDERRLFRDVEVTGLGRRWLSEWRPVG